MTIINGHSLVSFRGEMGYCEDCEEWHDIPALRNGAPPPLPRQAYDQTIDDDEDFRKLDLALSDVEVMLDEKHDRAFRSLQKVMSDHSIGHHFCVDNLEKISQKISVVPALAASLSCSTPQAESMLRDIFSSVFECTEDEQEVNALANQLLKLLVDS